MSMPTFPEYGLDITMEQAFNMLLGSIAMEELGLSHIINAEGEKLQYILGTLPKSASQKASTKELLEVNKSMTTMLEHVSHNQLLLKGKLAQVLEAQEKYNPPPCPPPCPSPGPPPCCDPCTRVAAYREDREGAWCQGQLLPWRACHCHGDACVTSTVACSGAECPCLINFHFELLPMDSGQIGIELLLLHNGVTSPLLKSGVYATAANQPVYISGSTVLVPSPKELKSSSLAFSLCEPRLVRVKRAKLTLVIV